MVPCDADELVKVADEAYAIAPSDGARATQNVALLMRAHITFERESPEFAALAKKYRRTLASYLISIVLVEGGPLAAKALNPLP